LSRKAGGVASYEYPVARKRKDKNVTQRGKDAEGEKTKA
jgi:hypothetical protein